AVGERAACLQNLPGGEMVAVPVEVLAAELEGRGVGLLEQFFDVSLIHAVPREGCRGENIEEAVHASAWAVLCIGERADRADGMMQPGGGFERDAPGRRFEQERSELTRRRDRLGRKASGADLGPASLKFRERNLTVGWQREPLRQARFDRLHLLEE